ADACIMLFIHFVRQERIDIRDGDRLKSAPSLKQLNKEWAQGTAAAFDRSRRKISVFFHKSSEFGQHLVTDRYQFGCSLETVEKGQPFSRRCYEVVPRPLGMGALSRRPVVIRPSG